MREIVPGVRDLFRRKFPPAPLERLCAERKRVRLCFVQRIRKRTSRSAPCQANAAATNTFRNPCIVARGLSGA